MIRINLLPEEYRRRSRTPVKLLLAFSAAVAVNALLLSWWGWLAFGVKAEIESERTVLQTEMDGITPQVNYHKSLEGERGRFASRESALAAITKSRIPWTRKVDELVDVVNDGGEGRRHFVWFDDLIISQTANQRTKSGGSVKAAGHSGSDDFRQVANFLEDLERSPFVQDFDPPAPPEGTQTLVDEELVPPVVWAFPLSLSLKGAPEDPKKAAPKPGAPAAAKPDAPAAPATDSTTPPATGAAAKTEVQK
jgi:Tfp pilus assembly protein PilN